MSIRSATQTKNTATYQDRSIYEEDTLESAHEKARALGRIVLFPTEYELFVDIDNEAAMRRFNRIITHLAPVNFAVRPSPSGERGHHHIVVTLGHPVTPVHRIALQAMLGSDPVREILSWKRIRRGIDEPTLFFELPTITH